MTEQMMTAAIEAQDAVTVDQAMAELDAALKQLIGFRMEYGPLFERLAEYEQAVEAAKERLAAVMARENVKGAASDAFRVTLVRQDRGTYDVDALPAFVRDIPGVVVRTVDRKKVEGLVKAGILSKDAAAKAWRGSPAKPFVRVQTIIPQE